MGFRVLWLIFLGFASSLSSMARCNWTVSPDERILQLGMHVGHVLTHPLRVGVFDSTFLFISSFGDFLYLFYYVYISRVVHVYKLQINLSLGYRPLILRGC